MAIYENKMLTTSLSLFKLFLRDSAAGKTVWLVCGRVDAFSRQNCFMKQLTLAIIILKSDTERPSVGSRPTSVHGTIRIQSSHSRSVRYRGAASVGWTAAICAKLSIRGPRSNVRFLDLVASNRTVANPPSPVVGPHLTSLEADVPRISKGLAAASWQMSRQALTSPHGP